MKSTGTFSPPVIVLGFALLLLLTGFIARPTGLMMVFSRKHKTAGQAATAGYVGFGLIVLYVVFFILAAVAMRSDIPFEIPNLSSLKIAYLALLLNLAMLYFTAQAWIQKFWGVAGRIHYSLLTVSSLGLFWFLYYWKII